MSNILAHGNDNPEVGAAGLWRKATEECTGRRGRRFSAARKAAPAEPAP
ncbi:hypothetical protein HNR19_000305 [Nocardioides thalensis]|uniref:Uncharacterized protein n=1 Tax=Nocardioides thalensis TaxID=1914755 RepID=A0A853BXN6_9ACTN|nr:hypothetical protein [Nocardioides thalensis]NYI99606.1 hypothetical protein [Nocardioides thalensis]